MPTIQLPETSVVHCHSLFGGVSRVSTSTVSPMEEPQSLKCPIPPSVVDMTRARGGGGSLELACGIGGGGG